MTTSMKLIFENYRRGMLYEEEDIQRVGDLIKAIEAHILANSDRLKRVCQALISALETFASEFEEEAGQYESIIETLTEIFEQIVEDGLKATIAKIGAKKLIGYMQQIINTDAIKQYLLKKIGEKTIKFVMNEIVPAIGSLIRFGKWIYKLFKVGKEIKDVLESGTVDPNKAFTMIVKDVMTAEDNKETTAGFLGLLNIDDEWQKMLDDKIEMEFIQDSIAHIKSLGPDTSIDQLNLNQRLIDFLKAKFDGRTLTK